MIIFYRNNCYLVLLISSLDLTEPNPDVISGVPDEPPDDPPDSTDLNIKNQMNGVPVKPTENQQDSTDLRGKNRLGGVP